MEIRRIINGKEYSFELTSDELANAYFEQEYEWDRESMSDWVDSIGDCMMDCYGVSYDSIKANVNYLASELRRNITKYDLDYQSARDEAIDFVTSRIKDGTLES